MRHIPCLTDAKRQVISPLLNGKRCRVQLGLEHRCESRGSLRRQRRAVLVDVASCQGRFAV